MWLGDFARASATFDAIERLRSSQEQSLSGHCRRCHESIVQFVLSDLFEFITRLDDRASAFLIEEVEMILRGKRRCGLISWQSREPLFFS